MPYQIKYSGTGAHILFSRIVEFADAVQCREDIWQGAGADSLTVTALPALPVTFVGGGGSDRLFGPVAERGSIECDQTSGDRKHVTWKFHWVG